MRLMKSQHTKTQIIHINPNPNPNPAKETTDNLFIPLILPDTAIRREL